MGCHPRHPAKVATAGRVDHGNIMISRTRARCFPWAGTLLTLLLLRCSGADAQLRCDGQVDLPQCAQNIALCDEQSSVTAAVFRQVSHAQKALTCVHVSRVQCTPLARSCVLYVRGLNRYSSPGNSSVCCGKPIWTHARPAVALTTLRGWLLLLLIWVRRRAQYSVGRAPDFLATAVWMQLPVHETNSSSARSLRARFRVYFEQRAPHSVGRALAQLRHPSHRRPHRHEQRCATGKPTYQDACPRYCLCALL